MTVIRGLLFAILIGLYCFSFAVQDRLFQERPVILQPIPTAAFLRATTGYLRQIVAEISFVQTSVFLGGLKQETDPLSYAPVLTHNYQQITSLYPQFNDPYYYAQSYLAFLTPEYAKAVNDILTTGRKAYPKNLIYPFFQGFNLFRYIEEPIKAAEVFRNASQLPDAPPMFAHLAVILNAQGGQLQAAIITLQAMLKSTDDQMVKERYQSEILMFQQALMVQKAVNAFHETHQRYPAVLTELVPEFLDTLPFFGQSFELTWTPPTVALKRPSR